MEFRVLGPLEVRRDGVRLALGGVKQRALLALLLLEANRVVPKDRLIDTLWGVAAPKTASAALQVYVSQLRKTLDATREGHPPVLVTRSPGYLIRVEEGELDLERFERLVADARTALADDPAAASAKLHDALSLWRGPPLADVGGEASFFREAARLEELRFAALEDRIEADLALGRHAQLVAELQGLVATHPLRERLRGQLMLALYRSERQADALAAYQTARHDLVEELGIDPSPTLQQLERAILRQDTALDWKPAAVREAPSTGPATPLPAQRSILLVARDDTGVEAITALAAPLATCREPHVLILARVVGTADGAADLSAVVADLNAHKQRLVARGVAVRAAAFASFEPGNDIVHLASEQDVDLMVLETPTDKLVGARVDAELSAVLAQSPCDVAILVMRDGDEGADGRSVLVPFGGVQHDWAALELGAWIASAQNLPLRLLGVRGGPSARQRGASRLLASASLAVQQLVGLAPEPVLLAPGANGLLAAADDAGLLVIGLPPQWRHEGLGDVRTTVVRRAAARTLVVHRGPRPGGLAPRATLTHFTWSLSGAEKAQAG